MNTLTFSPGIALEKIPSELTARVTIVGMFADEASGREAMELQRHLSERLGSDWVLNCSRWRFDALRASFAEVARAGAEADMIIVAAPDRKLPAVVEVWLDQALAREAGNERALIALLGGPAGSPPARSPLGEHLKGLAEEAGITFFAHWFEWPPPGPTSFREELNGRAHVITRTLEEILTHPLPPPRWGINE